MKKEQLFDILGDIDDKFYEEAKGEDALQPIIIGSGGERKKNPLKIAIPAAACIAVAAVGITLGLRKNSGVPIEPDDTSLNDGSVFEEISVPDINSGAVYIEEYSESDIERAKELIISEEGISQEEADSFYYRTNSLDIDGDGYPELLINRNVGYTPAYILKKQGGDMTIVGKIATDENRFSSVEDLYMYNGDDGSYAYYFSVDSGANRSADAKVLWAIKYDGEKYYTEPLLAYGKAYGNDSYADDREVVFWKRGWDSNTISIDNIENPISEEEFRELWAKYPALPEIELPERADERFRPVDYPMIDTVEIPDLERNYGGGLSGDFMSRCLDKAALTHKSFGEYDFYLTAKNVRTHSDDDRDDVLYAYDFGIGVCRNGVPIADSIPYITTGGMAVGEYEFYIDRLNDYLEVMTFTFDDGKEQPILAIHYIQENGYSETSFFTVSEDTFGFLAPDLSELGIGMELSETGNPNVSIALSENYSYMNNVLTDIDSDIEYTFSQDKFENIACSGQYLNNPVDLSEYPLIDVSVLDENSFYEKAALFSKQCGEYTLTMIAHNVSGFLEFDSANAIMCADPCVIVTKNGKYIGFSTEYHSTALYYLNADNISDYVMPFEMKDGLGYAERSYDMNVASSFARFISLKDDNVTVMEGPSSKSDYRELDKDAEILYDENIIATHILNDDGETVERKYKFFFDQSVFAVTE